MTSTERPERTLSFLVFVKADLHGTTLSHAICLRQVYDMNRFV